MKLKFLLANVKRDLRLLEYQRGYDGMERVKVEDVVTVLERWESALADEYSLTEQEQRFQDIIYKNGKITRAEVQEALELLMFIHRPLIRGRNDVIGIRLQDADYIRLQNKILGQDLETNLDAYNEKIAAYEAAIRKKEQEERRKREARQRAKETEELAKLFLEEQANRSH